MTKSELIDAMAARGDLTKARAELVVNCVFDEADRLFKHGEPKLACEAREASPVDAIVIFEPPEVEPVAGELGSQPAIANQQLAGMTITRSSGIPSFTFATSLLPTIAAATSKCMVALQRLLRPRPIAAVAPHRGDIGDVVLRHRKIVG